MKFRFAAKAAAALLAAGVCTAVSAQLNIDFSNARGIGTAPGKMLIENIKVLTPVTNPFTGTSTTVETGYNVIFDFDPASLHLIPSGITQSSGSGASTCATAAVQVYNSVLGASGGGLSGATVTIGTRSATTNSSGVATVTGLPEGLNSISVTGNGYVSATQSATLSCASTNTVAVAVSPAAGTTGGLTSGQFRVILTWGQNPSDLDSHMTGGTSADSTTRWHLYYSNKTAGGVCKLDVDDTSSYGPETVTCPATGTTTSLPDGVYRYSVHHYSGSGNIGTSGATVRLEFGNGTVYNYAPPASGWAGSRDVWTVFELTVSGGSVSVAPVNTVSTGVSSGSVRARKAPLFGEPEDTRLFLNLAK